KGKYLESKRKQLTQDSESGSGECCGIGRAPPRQKDGSFAATQCGLECDGRLGQPNFLLAVIPDRDPTADPRRLWHRQHGSGFAAIFAIHRDFWYRSLNHYTPKSYRGAVIAAQ